MHLTSATAVPFETLLTTFNHGYDGYLIPVRLTAEQFHQHLTQNSIDLAHSVVAWEGETPVGAGLLAQREDRGWIGGMGVIPAYRRRGIGRALMQHMLLTAQQQGIAQVQLEVLHGNVSAVALYQSLDFVFRRRLLMVEALHIPPQADGYTVQPAALADALGYFVPFETVPNPWQRDLPGLSLLPGTIPAYLAEAGGQVVAYVIAAGSEHGVSIIDLGYAPGHPNALGVLLAHLSALYPGLPLRLTNIGEDEPQWEVLRALDFRERFSQYEMVRSIAPEAE